MSNQARAILAGGLVSLNMWNPVAQAYNGSGYATHDYHGKLAAAFRKWASK